MEFFFSFLPTVFSSRGLSSYSDDAGDSVRLRCEICPRLSGFLHFERRKYPNFGKHSPNDTSSVRSKSATPALFRDTCVRLYLHYHHVSNFFHSYHNPKIEVLWLHMLCLLQKIPSVKVSRQYQLVLLGRVNWRQVTTSGMFKDAAELRI